MPIARLTGPGSGRSIGTWSHVNSILRDWVTSQITAVETGVLGFEGVFLSYMITDNGQPLIDRLDAQGLLPSPKDQKP